MMVRTAGVCLLVFIGLGGTVGVEGCDGADGACCTSPPHDDAAIYKSSTTHSNVCGQFGQMCWGELDWGDLTDCAQTRWASLGYDETIWIGGDEPAHRVLSDKDWADLTAAETFDLGYLGYDATSWDGSAIMCNEGPLGPYDREYFDLFVKGGKDACEEHASLLKGAAKGMTQATCMPNDDWGVEDGVESGHLLIYQKQSECKHNADMLNTITGVSGVDCYTCLSSRGEPTHHTGVSDIDNEYGGDDGCAYPLHYRKFSDCTQSRAALNVGINVQVGGGSNDGVPDTFDDDNGWDNIDFKIKKEAQFVTTVLVGLIVGGLVFVGMLVMLCYCFVCKAKTGAIGPGGGEGAWNQKSGAYNKQSSATPDGP